MCRSRPPMFSSRIRSLRARTSGMRRGRTGREVSTCDGCVAVIRRSRSQPASNCSAAICFASSAPNPSWKGRWRRSAPMWIPTQVSISSYLGLAIFLGGVIGVLVTFSVGGVKISLSTSVGTLLAGLVVGYLRSLYPLFGRIPEGSIALMTSLGLAAFVGLTGIHAGPIFFSALREAGIGLLFGGMVVTLLPQVSWVVLRPFRTADEPDPPPRGFGRRTNSDGSDGRRPRALGEPRRGAGLCASISGCEHPPDHLGHDYRSCYRRPEAAVSARRPQGDIITTMTGPQAVRRIFPIAYGTV